VARSIKKGPFVDEYLNKKAANVKEGKAKNPVIKTWARRSTITPDYVGLRFAVHNGKEFIPVYVTENMVGHKLGEFAHTRKFKGHTPADKKEAASESAPAAAPAAAAAKPAAAKA